jgi:hypothetical protein
VEPLNLEQYLDDSINIYSGEEGDFKNVEILERESTQTKVAGQQDYRLIITAEVEGDDHKLLEIGTIYKGKPYFITYSAKEDLYEKYLPAALKIIRSFTFTK